MKFLPNKLTASQRAKVKLAKLNQSTAKSAISEAGKTIRNVAANIGANQGYKTYSNTKIGQSMANQANAKMHNDAIDKALALYNKMFEGNADSQGEKGSTSTTEVGGAGSAIGG